MTQSAADASIVIVGGGIGGLACALALANKGFRATVLEQGEEFREIGAGIQLGPNAFHALDRLGLGEALRANAVFIDRLVMMDSLSGEEIIAVPVDEPFRKRFGNPYAVIHRGDLHELLLQGCRAQSRIALLTRQRVAGFEETASGVEVWTEEGRRFAGAALVGADGLRSRIREAIVGDGAPRVAGHTTYRAVLPIEEMPEDLRWNAATLWAGPNSHLVHYPLRGWKLFNIVATFHSAAKEPAANEPGSRDEILHAFREVGAKPRSILEKPSSWRYWVLCDREPVANWSRGRATLLGDAAHPMLQYFAQGACMALEDAVALADRAAAAEGDFAAAFLAYQKARLVRTARVQWSSRMLGEIYHAKGVYRLLRNQIFGGRSPERSYEGLAWIYGGPEAA
jgi:2-polyprenyl-6-methoxyphenol hydroxylase-like FAD-dependent oxidoreductase